MAIAKDSVDWVRGERNTEQLEKEIDEQILERWGRVDKLEFILDGKYSGLGYLLQQYRDGGWNVERTTDETYGNTIITLS